MTTAKFSRITVYHAWFGNILWTMSAPVGQEAASLGVNEAWIVGHFDQSEYRIDPVSKQPVPLLEYAVVIETNRISNIPAGAMAMIAGQRYEVDETGEIEFELELPQIVHVALSHPLYRAHEDLFAVTCEPAP